MIELLIVMLSVLGVVVLAYLDGYRQGHKDGLIERPVNGSNSCSGEVKEYIEFLENKINNLYVGDSMQWGEVIAYESCLKKFMEIYKVE